MKNILLLASLMLAALTVHATPNLAVICAQGATAGQAVNAETCVHSKYALPQPADLVRKGLAYANFVWSRFDSLSETDTFEVCPTDIPNPTAFPEPWSFAADPCHDWQPITKTVYATVNTTGTFGLTWTKPAFSVGDLQESQLTAYNVYSAVFGNAMTLLRTIPASLLSTTVGGYGTGKYSFSITAVYGALGESIKTGPKTIEVQLPTSPVPLLPGQPQSLSISSVTVE